MLQAKGTLIPIGGNEDKGEEIDDIHRLDYITEGILQTVVMQAGGIDASILILPMASSIPAIVGKGYVKAFKKLGCTNLEVLHISQKKNASKEANIQLLQKADCVMFSGGDQSKITQKIGGTLFHDILQQRFLNDSQFVIAGTSAGAMAMSSAMITGGSATESFIKGAVRMSEGLGLLPNLIIDTHFIRRGRFGRQAEAVSKFPDLLGIGLSEDTGMIIKNGTECTVIGSGMVIVFDPSQLSHNNHEVLNEDTPMSITNLKVHVLANGDELNLNTRHVQVLDIKAPFI